MKVMQITPIVILATSIVVFAQSPMPAPPYGDYQQPVQTLEQKWADIQNDLRRNQYSTTSESRVLKQGLFAPSAADRLNSNAFLRTPDSGLILLLPEKVLDTSVYRDHKELRVFGAGSFYSFARLSHGVGYTSDVKLENGNLSTGFGGIHLGIFRDLGDVPLENLTPNDPRVEFLSRYEAPQTFAAMRAEASRFQQGVQQDNAVYRSEVPVGVNSTFLLRSITYSYLHGSDVLIAMRVLRQADDGSVTIAWKRLQKYHAPKRLLNRPVNAPQIQTNRWPTR
jgi:hypothetical protein